MSEHYVVLGLARVRAAWFREVSRWATSAALPVDFVKCVSPNELRARLASGRACSAVLVDGGLAALDRDLVAAARDVGCAVLVVDDGQGRRDWSAVAPAAVLPAPLDRATLLAALREHGRELTDIDAAAVGEGPPASAAAGRGRLVAVTGPAGSGSSVVAMALAQGLAAAGPLRGDVVLADLALHADQAVLHDTGDVVPALQELVEAHRRATLSVDEVRSLTFGWEDRGYRLLVGLRRHRDWAALRPRATDAALDGLCHAFAVTVADVDPDVEGEDECGSIDVEERNHLTRAALARADVVVLTVAPTVVGVHRAVRALDDLRRFGVPGQRVLPVVTQAPRAPGARAELAATLGRLAADAGGATTAPVASPLFLPARRRLDDVIRDASPLPRQLCDPLAQAVGALFARVPIAAEPEPVAVAPGSLGSADALSDP